LLVEPDRAAAERLVSELAARGLSVECRADASEALRFLREQGADAVALAAPLAEADWIAAAIAVKESPAAPALLLLDGTGQGDGLARILPAERAPDAVLAKPVSSAKLLLALVDALQWKDARADLPTGPTFPELLVDLGERRETGVLEVRADGLCTRIALREGAPVFAEGGALRETLGRMLLRRGAIDGAAYLRVIERMTERLIENEATRMGEVLVELGLLTPKEVFEALSAQVLEKIMGCFRWLRFAHHFEAQEALSADVAAFPGVSVDALVLAGLRAHFGSERLEPLLELHEDRYPRLRLPPAELAQRFQMAPAEERVIHAIRGETTLRAVRAASPIDSVQTAQVLAALAIGRVLAWADAPDVAMPFARTPATRPATAAPPCRPGTASPARPTPTRARAARLEAERSFQQGLGLLEQALVPGALRAFARASELAGDEPEYRMFEAWAEYLSAQEDEPRALARVKATACAQRMLERERDSVRAHDILGQLAIASGSLEEAGRHFEAALRVAPADRDALRGLRSIEQRRAKE
jgi:CheY-like chemotaxis protein